MFISITVLVLVVVVLKRDKEPPQKQRCWLLYTLEARRRVLDFVTNWEVGVEVRRVEKRVAQTPSVYGDEGSRACSDSATEGSTDPHQYGYAR